MKRWDIFVSGKLSEKAENQLAEFAQTSSYNSDDPLAPEDLLRHVRAKDALVCILGDKVNAAVLEQCPRLKLVANVAVGYDNINIKDANERGVLVTNTPGVLDNATADLAFGLLLASARRIAESDRFVRAGSWKGWKRDLMLGSEIHGKTLGIVGMGRIGEAMARRAQGFGLSIVYTRQSSDGAKDERMLSELGARRVSLDELLKTSDFISVHCPLNDGTRHMIGKDQFAVMKPNCHLINTSRGALIDQRALVKALDQEQIAGAGLDVFDGEPAVPEELMRMDNVVLTPHIGSASRETRAAMDELAVSAVIKALNGDLPANAVNPEVWTAFRERLAETAEAV